MQQIIGLFFKDFLGFFRSYLGYAVIFVYLSVSSLLTFYGGGFFSAEDSSFYSFFSLQPVVLSFIIPLLAAKVFNAEEEKNGNFEFLLTQPLKYKHILLAKVWAIFAFSLLLIGLSIFQLVKISAYMEIQLSQIFSSYIGLILLALSISMLCTIINLIAKSAFAAYMISALISIIFCNSDFFWLAGIILNLCGIYSPATEYALSLSENYDSFIRGEIALNAVLFFVTLVAMLAFIGYVIFGRNRGLYKKAESYTAILIIFFSFVLFSLGSKALFLRQSIDLTPTKEYSLSQKSYDISNMLEQKVHIKLYVSDSVGKVYHDYERYITYVISQLEKYASISNDLSFEIINPQPYSVEAEDAKQSGLEPILDDNGNPLYFGAQFIAEDNRTQVIPLFLKERKYQLEEDISFALLALKKDYKKPIIGIMAPNLPVLRNTYDYKYENLAFVEKLMQHYDLIRIGDNAAEIPTEIQSLLIINPHKIQSLALKALDQYILMGGNVVVFADPYSEEEVSYKSQILPLPTTINDFLHNYGLEFSSEYTLANYKYAAKTFMNKDDKMATYDYPLWLDLPAEVISSEKIAGKLSSLRLKTAGIAGVIAENNLLQDVQYESLLELSEENGFVTSILISRDNKDLNKSRIIDVDAGFNLGVIAKGKFWSAFQAEGSGLNYSAAPASVVLIADSDFLFNDSVIQTENSVDIKPYLFVEKNDNLQFLLNLLAYIGGDDEYNVLRKGVAKEKTASANVAIKQFAAQKYKEKLLQVSSQLAMLDLKIENAAKNVNSFSIISSPEEIKRFHALKEQRDNIIAEKMKLEYEIENDFESIKTDLIVTTVFWWPFLITCLFMIILLIISSIRSRYIRRIMQ